MNYMDAHYKNIHNLYAKWNSNEGATDEELRKLQFSLEAALSDVKVILSLRKSDYE